SHQYVGKAKTSGRGFNLHSAHGQLRAQAGQSAREALGGRVRRHVEQLADLGQISAFVKKQQQHLANDCRQRGPPPPQAIVVAACVGPFGVRDVAGVTASLGGAQLPLSRAHSTTYLVLRKVSRRTE